MRTAIMLFLTAFIYTIDKQIQKEFSVVFILFFMLWFAVCFFADLIDIAIKISEAEDKK